MLTLHKADPRLASWLRDKVGPFVARPDVDYVLETRAGETFVWYPTEYVESYPNGSRSISPAYVLVAATNDDEDQRAWNGVETLEDANALVAGILAGTAREADDEF